MNSTTGARALRLALGAALLIFCQASQAAAPTRAERVFNAIVELDLGKARKLLSDDSHSQNLPLERARLALYTGDCDAAQAVLSGPSTRSTREGAELLTLATSCAKATAGALVVKDEQAAVHVRLQDSRDKALVPFIVKVAVKARAAMLRDLGVELPRPLRIDLVRDTFSLSALTGLAVTAAETTGTLAVARWGRVTMISPRATRLGFGWEDTLAHEITHLALSRATRDRAPLWLQEGIAKREETRWREPRPGDGQPPSESIAYQAMVSGRSVGIDKLGPSIAMLPTPEAASIAYAEVQSFVDYWIAQNGEAALRLLLADLKGMPPNDATPALRSVSGYTLEEWNLRWRDQLAKHPPSNPPSNPPGAPHQKEQLDGQALARWLRLADLFYRRGHYDAASATIEPALDAAGDLALVRWRAARAALADHRPQDAEEALGGVSDIDIVHGAWYALKGRFWKERGEVDQARRAFDLALSVDPLFDEVACEGHLKTEEFSSPSAEREALCKAARAIDR